MTEPTLPVEDVPSAGASLESLSWLILSLNPVASKDVMAHLLGVREFVRAVHRTGWDRQQIDGTHERGGVMYKNEYRDDPLQDASRFQRAMEELTNSLGRCEKNWEMIAMRLAPFLGETLPNENAPTAAPPVVTSSAVRGLYDLAERLREFSGRLQRVQGRLEL